jgi:hypothetical protein
MSMTQKLFFIRARKGLPVICGQIEVPVQFEEAATKDATVMLRVFKWDTMKERHLRLERLSGLTSKYGFHFFKTEKGLKRAMKKINEGKHLIREASRAAK